MRGGMVGGGEYSVRKETGDDEANDAKVRSTLPAPIAVTASDTHTPTPIPAACEPTADTPHRQQSIHTHVNLGDTGGASSIPLTLHCGM